jgi:hypothetical protein
VRWRNTLTSLAGERSQESAEAPSGTQVTPSTQLAYDPLDRVTRTTYPDGAVDSKAYSIASAPAGASMFLAVRDANGHPHELYSDLLARKVAHVEHPDDAALTGTGTTPSGSSQHRGCLRKHQVRRLRPARAGGFAAKPRHRPHNYDLAGNLVVRQEPNHRPERLEITAQILRARLR